MRRIFTAGLLIGFAAQNGAQYRRVASRYATTSHFTGIPLISSTEESPPRTVIVNWGGPAINEEQQQYIWHSNRTAEYHTFLLVTRGQVGVCSEAVMYREDLKR